MSHECSVVLSSFPYYHLCTHLLPPPLPPSCFRYEWRQEKFTWLSFLKSCAHRLKRNASSLYDDSGIPSINLSLSLRANEIKISVGEQRSVRRPNHWTSSWYESDINSSPFFVAIEYGCTEGYCSNPGIATLKLSCAAM